MIEEEILKDIELAITLPTHDVPDLSMETIVQEHGTFLRQGLPVSRTRMLYVVHPCEYYVKVEDTEYALHPHTGSPMHGKTFCATTDPVHAAYAYRRAFELDSQEVKKFLFEVKWDYEDLHTLKAANRWEPNPDVKSPRLRDEDYQEVMNSVLKWYIEKGLPTAASPAVWSVYNHMFTGSAPPSRAWLRSFKHMSSLNHLERAILYACDVLGENWHCMNRYFYFVGHLKAWINGHIQFTLHGAKEAIRQLDLRRLQEIEQIEKRYKLRSALLHLLEKRQTALALDVRRQSAMLTQALFECATMER